MNPPLSPEGRTVYSLLSCAERVQCTHTVSFIPYAVYLFIGYSLFPYAVYLYIGHSLFPYTRHLHALPPTPCGSASPKNETLENKECRR